MRVQRNDERVTILDVPAHPFDLVRINIRHRDLHCVRQVQNHFVLRRRLPDRLGNLPRIFHFRHAETFRRILKHDFRSLEPVQAVFDPLRAANCNLDDFHFRFPEHDAALCRRGRIVKMDDDLFCADERFDGAFDQILARLHEHLEPYIVRRALLLDEPAVEGELGVRRGRKADFDFLEASFHERLEQLQFLRNVHRHGERLVAVAQIHAAPDGRAGEDAVGPLPVGQADRRKRTVFLGRILMHKFRR